MKDVEIHSFAGINNVDAPERVNSYPTKDHPMVDLVEAVNVDIDETGRIVRRAGITMLVPGSAHSLWSNGQVCLYVSEGVLYQLDEDFNSTAIAGGLEDLPMAYVEIGDRIYHSNGDTAAVLDNGAVRSWGIPINLTDVQARAAGGNMQAGFYLVAMTLVRGDGQESGCGLAHRVDLQDNGGIAFSWAVPDDLSITQANLYVTQPNSETLMLAATVDVELGSYLYTGGQRALPLATQWLDAPPVGEVLASFKGRIYIGSGSFVYVTAPLSYEHCDLRDFFSIDGTAVRVIAPVEGGLFVGTENGIYFVAGASFKDNALVKKMDARVIPGTTVLADGAAVTGRKELSGMQVVLFTTTEGIVLGMSDGSLTNLTFERYDLEASDRGAAVFREDPAIQYLVST